MNEMTDEIIACKVKSGEQEMYGLLIERYEPKLTRYVSKFIVQKDDVTDLVQDVFTKAFINIQSYDDSQPFSPWIYRIAHNESMNHIKRKRFKPFSFFDFEVDEFFPQFKAKEAADEKTNQFFDKKIIDEVLSELDPKYREVIVLHHYEELSYKAIASILHIPVTLVGVRLKRAKESIKKILHKKGITYDNY
jgi:RNA polymerase sigma-70 factor (ECF subfamily)